MVVPHHQIISTYVLSLHINRFQTLIQEPKVQSFIEGLYPSTY